MRTLIIFVVACGVMLSCCNKVKKVAPLTTKPAVVAVAKDTTKAMVKDTTKAITKETAKEPAKK